MKIKCIIFGHKFDQWVSVKPIGKYEERLKRTCKICGKIETYTGFIQTDIVDGSKSPYILKH